MTFFLLGALIPFRFYSYGAASSDSLLEATVNSQVTLTEIPKPIKIAFTIGSIYFLFYGIFTFVSIFMKPIFANSLCIIIQMKYSFDFIIASIRALIDIWGDVPSPITFGIFSIIFVITFFLSFIITQFIGYIYRKKFDDPLTAISKLSSKSDTVTILRLSFIFQFSHIITLDFLKWISKWQSSPELIAEVIRICISQKLPMNEIMTSNLTMNSYKMLKIKFIAFQFRKYVRQTIPIQTKIKGKPSDQKMEYLRSQNLLAKNLYESFWNTTTITQINFHDFFDQISQIPQKFQQSQEAFPHNQEIKKLYNGFQNEFMPNSSNESPFIINPKLLFSSFNQIYKNAYFEAVQETAGVNSKLNQKLDFVEQDQSVEQNNRNNFNTVDRPALKTKRSVSQTQKASPYTKYQFNTTSLVAKKILKTSQFLFDDSNESELSDGDSYKTFSNRTSNSNLTGKSRDSHTGDLNDDSEISLDSFFNRITFSYLYPLYIFLIIFYFAFVVIILILEDRTFKRTRGNADLFNHMTLFLSMQPELMTAKLSIIDRNVVFPSSRELSKLLGIDEETASAFLSARIAVSDDFSHLDHLFPYFNYYPYDFPDSINQDENSLYKCNYLSFALLLKSITTNFKSKADIYCRISYINLYSAFISNITSYISQEVLPVQFQTTYTNQIILLCFILVSLVLFIIFLVNDISKMKKIIKCTKAVTNNEVINHENEAFISKITAWTILVFILILGFSLLILAVIDIPEANNSEHIIKLLYQIVCVSGIFRYAQDSLAAAAVPYVRDIDIPMEPLSPKELLGNNSPKHLISVLDFFNEIGPDPVFKDIYPMNVWKTVESNSDAGVNTTSTVTIMNHTLSVKSSRKRSKEQNSPYSYEITDQSFSSLLLDYAHLLLNGEDSDPYDFFYGRFIFIFNIYPLVHSTIMEMVDAATNHIELYSFDFLVQTSILSAFVHLMIILMIPIFWKKSAWYNGAQLLLRYAAKTNKENIIIIRKQLSNLNKNEIHSFYLDELNFGVVVKNNKTGRILAANTKAEEYASQPIQNSQMIGQKFKSVFEKKDAQNNSVREVINEFNDIDTSLLIMKDKDMDYRNSDLCQSFLNGMHISIGNQNLPIRDNFILIKMRFNAETNFDIIEPYILDVLDQDLNFHIFRIGVGIGFYVGIASFNNRSDVIEFIRLVEKTALSVSHDKTQSDSMTTPNIPSNASQNFLIICATYGMCTLIAGDDNESNLIVCGCSDHRQNDLLLRAHWGRIYVDMSITQNSSVPSEWLIISPVERPV